MYQPPADQGLTILYQDADLLAVDKTSGLLSVPGRGEDKQDCQLSRAQQHCGPLYVLHRLDMDTSGILLFARHPQAQSAIARLFEQKQIHKTYITEVSGTVSADCGSIELPLHTDWPNRPKQHVDWQHGKPSLTHYQVLTRQTDYSRLALYPVTGRSHQLRVHLQAIGHPIIGDRLYQNSPPPANERLRLHAWQLQFIHPFSQQPIKLSSPIPF